MIITGIRAENFKVIKSVDVDIPEGTGIIKIIGNNGSGKSSLLEAIETALSGAGGTPFEPIRHGVEQATITIKLKDDELGRLSVTKILKKDKDNNYKKPTLIIRGENNTIFNSPQEMLDKFIGALSFEPLNFFNLKPEKQYNVLKDMLGLSKLDELDSKNLSDFNERTEVNREIKQKKTLCEAIKFSFYGEGGVLEKPKQVDVKKLVDKLQKVNDKNNKIINEQGLHEQKIIRSQELSNKVKKLKAELAAAELQLAGILDEIENYQKEELIDVNIIKKEIKEAEERNEEYHRHERRDVFIKEIDVLEKESEVLSISISQRNQEKLKLLAKAKMPIDGLNLDEGVIRYNGTALSECSTAERIKVSFAIGAASDYKLRTIFIKEGNLLDKKNLKLIKQIAKDHDYNIMIELLQDDGVNDKGSMKIIIEEGEIQ